MNEQETRDQLKGALQAAGSGWLLDYWGGNAEKQLDQVVVDLNTFAAEYERRFGEKPDPLALLHQDLFKGKAFFQPTTFTVSVDMQIMIWRILIGCEIMRVHFDYQLGKKPDFTVALRAADGSEEEYRGTGVWDFRVLRHFGAAGFRSSATGMQQGLVLQGFYAFK